MVVGLNDGIGRLARRPDRLVFSGVKMETFDRLSDDSGILDLSDDLLELKLVVGGIASQAMISRSFSES